MIGSKANPPTRDADKDAAQTHSGGSAAKGEVVLHSWWKELSGRSGWHTGGGGCSCCAITAVLCCKRLSRQTMV